MSASCRVKTGAPDWGEEVLEEAAGSSGPVWSRDSATADRLRANPTTTQSAHQGNHIRIRLPLLSASTTTPIGLYKVQDPGPTARQNTPPEYTPFAHFSFVTGAQLRHLRLEWARRNQPLIPGINPGARLIPPIKR